MSAAQIGHEIETILSIRNKVSGTAERGTGGGHGEAGHSGSLMEVEKALARGQWKNTWDEDRVSEQSRYSMWRLLDYDPANPQTVQQRNAVNQRVLTHFVSLRAAYPSTFQWLTDQGDYLFTYLEAHRDGVQLPLKRLSQASFNALRDHVHGSL
jgi:hypothetical protein